MNFPVLVSFRHLASSRAVENSVRENAARLAQLYDRIERCRVVIDMPHHRHHKGNHYLVKIAVYVKRHEIVVDHEPGESLVHEDPYAAIHDAFEAARNRIKTVLEKRDGRHSHRGVYRDSLHESCC